jgi:DNA-binding Lrp family transcriptional regulator
MIDWWSETDSEILGCLARSGPMAPGEIGAQVGLSEGEAITFLTRLAREGKVRIALVELGGEAARRVPGHLPYTGVSGWKAYQPNQ